MEKLNINNNLVIPQNNGKANKIKKNNIPQYVLKQNLNADTVSFSGNKTGMKKKLGAAMALLGLAGCLSGCTMVKYAPPPPPAEYVENADSTKIQSSMMMKYAPPPIDEYITPEPSPVPDPRFTPEVERNVPTPTPTPTPVSKLPKYFPPSPHPEANIKYEMD